MTRTNDLALEAAVDALLTDWFPDGSPAQLEEWKDIAYKDALTVKLALEHYGNERKKMELHKLTGGESLWTHDKARCQNTHAPCSIHSPSMHHMITWNMHWRGDRMMMERICTHGIGHPDPDDAAYRVSIGKGDSVHGCDGCCVPPQRIPSQATSPDSATQDAVSG